ncbi:hypothetical protein [Rodentibacter pneumotropicus]|uniref:hypothetical protein n=1 Tax=Rodentibacter pneumotropicus TaxID=758 RepID=UPI002675F1C8|nr:hypothetical protein [Rodentibacter pneumotropicus]
MITTILVFAQTIIFNLTQMGCIPQEQELSGKRYFPFCMKAETVQDKIKNGEIKPNPNY